MKIQKKAITMKVKVKYRDGTVIEYNRVISIAKKYAYVYLYYGNRYFERKFNVKSIEIPEI